MLTIVAPTNFVAHRKWICGVVFEEFLGIDYYLQFAHQEGWTVSAEGKRLEIPDHFFSTMRGRWLQDNMDDKVVAGFWEAGELLQDDGTTDPLVPCLFGSAQLAIESEFIRLPLDVLGVAFFYLSRYEEVVAHKKDAHGRFPFKDSVAAAGGFIERPLVDEYVEVLWAAIQRLWPSLRRQPREYRCFVSCDVDHPFDSWARSPVSVGKRVLGDLLKRGDLRVALDNLLYSAAVLRDGLAADRMWTFDWMMSVCERAGLGCAFYFITRNVHPLDGVAYWGNPVIDTLLQSIHERGHEIGLHASYASLDDPARIQGEYQELLVKCDQLGIEQDQWGGRQHYLRWSAKSTWKEWADAGIDYDATLTYAETPGFRCGTCHPYSVFDLMAGNPIDLVERPLIVMEVSLLSPSYQGLDHASAYDRALELQRTVRQFGGEFSLLWHNSHFQTAADRELYTGLLAACR